MSKNILNTKSRTYNRDKEVFLRELKQFNESKNVPYRIPTVNGIKIDLYHFYSLVQQRGGLSKVNQSDAWDSFMKPLHLPHPCINGSTLLRKIYNTYLEKYERAKAPAGRDDDNDLDDDPRRGRSSLFQRIPYTGVTAVTASGEQIRSAIPRVAGPSERLALSLLSPMPNEQDFAVNVCTILAADHSNRMPLSTLPHILDFLLAHAGVYNHSNLRETIGRSYYEARGRFPHEFWSLKSGGGSVKELVDETKFMLPGIEQPELMSQALAAQNALNDCLTADEDNEDVIEKALEEEPYEDWVAEPSEEDMLFAPELPGGAECVYTQRVSQIASIVRSLSFHEENVPILAKNTTLTRFLLLCSNSWVGSLRQSGLDTLGNISTDLIIKDPATCLISRHILSTIQTALVSQDRARILAALELLNKLAQNEANEDALLKALEDKVYEDICSLLTLRDIMVLVCALECVYAATSLGERASEAAARAPGLISTLQALTTVEAQSYGPRACILMRVVETISGPAPIEKENEKQPQTQQQTLQQPNAPVLVPLQKLSTSEQQLPIVAPQQQVAVPSPPAPQQPAVNSIQQSHLQQKTVQENEQFALAWLRTTFEPLPVNDNSTFDTAELYRQYLACCTKFGRKGVIAPAHFPRLVRTVFGGTVGPNTVTLSSGETQQAYIGIRPRGAKTQTVGPSSPILKAQLTSKVPVEVKPANTVTQPQAVPATPTHLNQALDPSASNTTLIKHLLAHKVSPALPQAQVTQRQQNQQKIISPSMGPQSTPMEVDPESLIKCTTITQGGVASSTPVLQGEKIVLGHAEDHLVPKEENIQIQFDEQTQMTIKATQNKMLADLLEKKSNPPVQVVQMAQQISAPTIQITETGQIVQVKQDNNPCIQINAEQGLIQQGNQYFHIKNEQGQIIQLKGDQIQGQMIQIKSEMQQFGQGGQTIQGQIIQNLANPEKAQDEHSYTEPPKKKLKTEDKTENFVPQESVSKIAANLYAAFAASALEDEEDLIPPKQEPTEMMTQHSMGSGPKEGQVIIQEPMLQVQQQQPQMHQQQMQMQQQTMHMQTPTIQQTTMQVQQPMLQVQPMDVQNILSSQSGQLILQEKPVVSQTQYVQQPMQLIATPANSQGGLSYLTQSIPANMMQKTIIIVQGPTGGGPLTLTVNNPSGLDEATLNTLIAQATEAITQQQIMQNSGVIQSTQRVIVSQPTLVSTAQQISVVKSVMQNAPQLTQSQQPIITTQPQPHKAQILNQPQQIVVTQKTTPTLINTSTGQIVSNQQIIQGNHQIIQANTQIIQGNQQILQGNPQLLHSNQQILQGSPQLIQGNQQIIQGNQQIIQGNSQIIQGNQQIIVSSNQQILVNSPIKSGVHRVVQSQRGQVVSSPTTIVNSDCKTSVIQSNTKPLQPTMRQVISRQPVMVGNTKIGEKEIIVNQPFEMPTTSTSPLPIQQSIVEESPWICHWRGCGKVFDSSSDVFTHAARVHCPTGAGGEAPCMWLDCDRVPRKTFALLNHLTDKHCTQAALKAIFKSRRHITSETEAGKPLSLGYPPNAAMAALNKHAADTFNPRELMDENEGPVTKSIRLTAALILRNLVIYSNTARRKLRPYESHLATIALSNVEASRTVAQVLFDMNNI